jgi:ureidoacrylate peracid hydrolase
MSNSLRTRQLSSLGDRPALVVVDVQRSFAEPALIAPYGLSPSSFESVAAAVTATAELVAAAREAGVPVVWVELGSDPARRWKASQWLRAGDPDAPYGPEEPCVLGTPGAEWWGMTPAEGEIRAVKRGYSGFLGTGLEGDLRAAGVDWLAVCGLTTECCVAATATDAAQLDWPVLIPQDAVAAYDPGVHEAALAQLAMNVAVLSDGAELTKLFSERKTE